ncbi:MAG: hypothetical protein PVG61_00440 [Dehalococcoidia bacterium]|jgi:hypothetical protein
MKKLRFIITTILSISLLPVAACGTDAAENYTPIPTIDTDSQQSEQEASDDVIFTPGGSAYRANVHQQGVENPWPPIKTVVTQMESDEDMINVRYRNRIVTEAGQTRNNILYMNKVDGSFADSGMMSMKLYSPEITSGLDLFQTSGGGLIGQLVAVLLIEITPDVVPGEYSFEIGIEIEGKDYGTIPCTIEVVENTNREESSLYHSEEGDLTVGLPDGWAAVEGPEYLAKPFEGQVSFNSWGGNDFWASEIHSGNSFTYNPGTVIAQIPEGGAYVVLVRIWGPSRPDEYNPPEYTFDDISELCKPHDWRQDSAGVQFFEFYKWGRDLRLEIACHPDASDETVAALNDLLVSWKFDTVPVGDLEWMGIQARKLLPEEVEPLKFSNRAGMRGDNGVGRVTEIETGENGMIFRFTYRWDSSSHWWSVQVSHDGDAFLTGEGGEPLP